MRAWRRQNRPERAPSGLGARLRFTNCCAEMCEFVLRNILELRTLLREDPIKSRAALARHIGQLKLTPKETEKGPVYEVEGPWSCQMRAMACRWWARDGTSTSAIATNSSLTFTRTSVSSSARATSTTSRQADTCIARTGEPLRTTSTRCHRR